MAGTHTVYCACMYITLVFVIFMTSILHSNTGTVNVTTYNVQHTAVHCIQIKNDEKNRSKEGPQKLPFYVIPVYLGNLTES